jgi:ATP-dependent RNA/DNA helicase IGHMBP2
MINTIDSFQGQEKDLIIITTVRSNDSKKIGFLLD